MCFPSRKGKNDPKDSSEVIRAAGLENTGQGVCVCVCVWTAWAAHSRDPTVFSAALSCIRPEWVSVFWISLGRIICHITICGHQSEDLSESRKTANGGFISWFRCALMLSLSSLDIMRAAENIQTWFFRIWFWGGKNSTCSAQIYCNALHNN